MCPFLAVRETKMRGGLISMAAPRWSFEAPQPWEERQGALRDRVARVGVEAQRVAAQQQVLLPTLRLGLTVDPAVGDHLQDVGKRILILQENAAWPSKKTLAIAQNQDERRRVIPSRFPEDVDDDENDRDVQGRIETMLMDQEWDTRTWSAAKIQVAVETLYEQVEYSDDPRRRELAITMLIRLLETHETAVSFVESTLPILVNKSFRSLSKIVDMTRIFRVCSLLAELSEWFAPILSRDNAIGKSISFLLRETELCARVVQHHWRGVLFERSLKTRDVDASVRARLRSMHFIKNVELRHQFKVFRDAVGVTGLPFNALLSYVKILFHLVKPTVSAVDKNRSHSPIPDQKRLLGSGILVLLVSLIPVDATRISIDQRDDRRSITELVKKIIIELARSFSDDADKIVSIMKSNISYRVVFDLNCELKNPQPGPEAAAFLRSSVEVVAAITRAVWQLNNNHHIPQDAETPLAGAAENTFLMNRLRTTAIECLMTHEVMDTLLLMLPRARQHQDSSLCELVLSTVRYLAGSYGFRALLDALTCNGGRALEQVILCFDDPSESVVRAAVALYHDMTDHPDARAGFTTVGAVLILSKWCSGSIEASKAKPRFVLALCCIVLLARQQAKQNVLLSSSSGKLVASLISLQERQEALYAILLDLVSGSSKDTKHSALFLHQTAGVFVPILLEYLVQVKPSDMEPAFQTRKQRSISCIVLSRFFKTPTVATAAFSESTVTHISLALQCSRLDEVEGKVRSSQCCDGEKYLHYLGLKECCKALSRLARCPTGGADLTLRPSITSGSVPLLPQAIICDVVTRLHVLEDIVPLIHVPTDATEFPALEVAMVHAAIELVGYLRPMPFGEPSRQKFLSKMANHPHGLFASSKLEKLVNITAPVVLHVLKEKNCGRELVEVCCAALSRLAATNITRSLLFGQGTLFVALTHVLEALHDTRATKTRGISLIVDASANDDGLLDVPASLITLLAKLCAIPDGRIAIMKAQVLPRVLKRLQITDSRRPDHDVDVKSEIAVLIRLLATCNAAEGNTSEQFLHFNVLELLSQIAKEHVRLLSGSGNFPSSVKMPDIGTSVRREWRILDNVVGAIAELAQDVLICAPRIVRLDVLSHLASLVNINSKTKHTSLQHRIVSLHYHVVNIAHAIASYPFGELQAYLIQLHISREATNEKGRSVNFVDQLKKIAFDFTLELNGSLEGELDARKTIGELAREIVALIREHESSKQTQLQRPSELIPPAVSPIPPRLSSPQITSVKARSPSIRMESSNSFPSVTPKYLGSPTRHPKEPDVKGPRTPCPPRSDIQLPTTLSRIDLLSTRPQLQPPSKEVVIPHYIFARPKLNSSPRHLSSRDESNRFLMLDPLFQNTVPAQACHKHRDKRSKSRELERSDEGTFVYRQEVDHHGHQVHFRARRNQPGDKYIPSHGHFR